MTQPPYSQDGKPKEGEADVASDDKTAPVQKAPPETASPEATKSPAPMKSQGRNPLAPRPGEEHLSQAELRAKRRQEAIERRQAAEAEAEKRRAIYAEKSAGKDEVSALQRGVAPSSGPQDVAPPVSPARLKFRHFAVLLSFLLFVATPTGGVAWYLWERAADQYASTVAFSVRKEETNSAVEFLGGITDLSGSNTADSDILYAYIQSQEHVAEIDTQINLRQMWSIPENDPVFGYEAPGTIEDLVHHWRRMVKVSYDSGTGILEVRALAFKPEDAQKIAQAIYDNSTAMINQISAVAREDAIKYAREELDQTVGRLTTARLNLTTFRNENQMVDPNTDIQTQAGLLGNLQGQLADAMIELDLLRATARDGDPRLEQAQRRIDVIEERIAAERRKRGIAGDDDLAEGFADLMGEYERLVVEREFAEQSYTSALAAYDAARAEARRQTRYLAAHILPTFAEKAEYPSRVMLLGLTALFILTIWSTVVLVIYALKDRR